VYNVYVPKIMKNDQE